MLLQTTLVCVRLRGQGAGSSGLQVSDSLRPYIIHSVHAVLARVA